MKIEDLSLEEKIGQMLIVGIEGNTITERTKCIIQKYKVGGVILYKKNYNSYYEMTNIIRELKMLNSVNKVPLFISVDQEGGRVNRMPKEILNFPSPTLIAKKLGENGVRDCSKIIGEILYKSGFNMNYAPVLDINRFQENKAIGDRCFGTNEHNVTLYGIIQMKQFQKEGIISVIKHFPGHGATKKDSHFGMPNIKIDINELEKIDMKPFEIAIQNGADCVLVGHLKIKNVTGYAPCTMSKKFITEYLRRKYKYNGLIISDDLKMRAIKNWYGYKKALVKAIQSGNDIVIFRYNKLQEESAIQNLINQTKKGKINIYKINESVNRILQIKEKYGLDDNKIIPELDIEQINSKIAYIRNSINEEN